VEKSGEENLKNSLSDYLRGELSHAGPADVDREAELNPLPGVGCSELLGHMFMSISPQ
jgi:hypothetical protein